MDFSTSELCDNFPELVDVVEPLFAGYGGRERFCGQLLTVKCFEDNGLIREVLEQNGEGKVLLVDGGGSLRRALVDSDMAQIAADNGWEGLIVYGSVREVDLLEETDIGIMAMAAIPIGADDAGTGENDIPVNFGGVTFLPEDYIYADSTGIVLSPDPLELSDDELDEPDED